MMSKRRLTVVKLLVLAAAITGSMAGTASAQPVFSGTFTLPYEAKWGAATLQPGPYSITVDSVSRPAVVRSLAGGSAVFVMARFIDDAKKNSPSALVLTRGEGEQRIVRSFNWSDGGKSFVYNPITQAERERFAQTNGADEVAIRTAKR